MKFENVKVGDTAFLKKYVSFDWGKGESFFIPRKVERITKTQIILENGNRYRKENGYRIGGYNSDSEIYLEGEGVSNETEKMKAFMQKIATERKINKLLEGLKIELNSGLTTEQLTQIETKANEIKAIISNQKQSDEQK